MTEILRKAQCFRKYYHEDWHGIMKESFPNYRTTALKTVDANIKTYTVDMPIKGSVNNPEEITYVNHTLVVSSSDPEGSSYSSAIRAVLKILTEIHLPDFDCLYVVILKGIQVGCYIYNNVPGCIDFQQLIPVNYLYTKAEFMEMAKHMDKLSGIIPSNLAEYEILNNRVYEEYVASYARMITDPSALIDLKVRNTPGLLRHVYDVTIPAHRDEVAQNLRYIFEHRPCQIINMDMDGRKDYLANADQLKRMREAAYEILLNPSR
jgi:hypothetical protein